MDTTIVYSVYNEINEYSLCFLQHKIYPSEIYCIFKAILI